jgi:7,8-dihydropterin-6-yl-methyl-4-(beta-D-ribofuranosyl)aminobenzene 5'-phosphate synthase
MEIKIVFDKEAKNKKYLTGWGISYLIDNNILFDTGEDWKYLDDNLNFMKINIYDIKTVVISPAHWDHTNGLWGLIKLKKDIKIIACAGIGKEFKDNIKKLQGNLKEVNKITMIKKNIYTTGKIEAEYKSVYMPEQALILKTKNGISVLTGCSHPGIVEMLQIIKKHFSNEKLYFVGGGFHLMDADINDIEYVVNAFKKMGVQKAGPSHCSGYDAQTIFKRAYGKNFIELKVGKTINV